MPETRLQKTRAAYECSHNWHVDTAGSEVCRKCGERIGFPHHPFGQCATAPDDRDLNFWFNLSCVLGARPDR